MHWAPPVSAAETLQRSTDRGWGENVSAGGRSDAELSASLVVCLKIPQRDVKCSYL